MHRHVYCSVGTRKLEYIQVSIFKFPWWEQLDCFRKKKIIYLGKPPKFHNHLELKFLVHLLLDSACFYKRLGNRVVIWVYLWFSFLKGVFHKNNILPAIYSRHPVDTGRKLYAGRKTYIRRSEDVKDVFWTSYLRSIYVLCLRGNNPLHAAHIQPCFQEGKMATIYLKKTNCFDLILIIWYITE